MRKIDNLLAEYGESHQNPVNKRIHWICVPLIFWTVTALLYSIALPLQIPFTALQVNLAHIALLLVFLYYVKLSLPLALGLLLFSVACLGLSYTIEQFIWPGKLWLIAIIVFIIAWIFQFIGHNIEGKKPSFLKDLQFLLIGPAWLTHFIYKKMRIAY